MDEVKIKKGTTRAIIHIPLSHIAAPYIKYVTKDILTNYEWDNINLKRVPLQAFTKYDKDTELLYVPINSLDHIVDMLETSSIPVSITDEEPYEERDIKIKMRSDFVPKKEQVGVIEYLSSPLPHRKGLATATGSGKTVSTIASVVAYGKAAMIVVSGLQDQWIRQFQHFTDIGDNIYLIQGYRSLINLMESEFKPDVMVFSLETLRQYVTQQPQYIGLPVLDDFLRYFGVGFKAMDEVHMNFHAQTMIDLSCNVNNNIYLTATFGASNFYTRKIINLIYPPDMRYGEHSHIKHVEVYCYTFRGSVPEKACMRRRGYMHAKYERHLLRRKFAIQQYFEKLMIIIQEQYILRRQRDEKMLVYFARIEMAKYAQKWFQANFPNLKSMLYIGGVKDDVLSKADILVTTPKKSGAGTDIKNLLFVLNTVSFKTEIGTEQMRGRLRQLPKGRTPTYAELVDLNIPAHCRHMKERSYVHKRSAKAYHVVNL